MAHHGPAFVAVLATSAGAATLVPLPVPGLAQPLVDPLGPASSLLAWCGLVFCALAVLFALLALLRADPAFGGLIILSAIGASFCLGPLAAVAMSGVVLAALPLLLVRKGAAPVSSVRQSKTAPAGPPRPRRLFA
ncbi:hypothetical protein [Acuticoccus yangtzensis]|uniref:hypothetical protein n=1 Tax=Acuticoccus yangtzensis TaxID=1443441 RepID=UPI00094996F8|nr:hypothetical protein [Acuticoccus yangtzensis]